MLNAKNILIVLAIGLLVGFCSGFYTESKFIKAAQVDAMVESRHDSAQGIEQSLEISANTDSQITASNQSNQAIRTIVAKRVQAHEKTIAINPSNGITAPSVCAWSIDVGTVRLLNSSRSGDPVDASRIGDAESQASSGVSASDFIDNDLQIVELYHELAIRHDSLVDYVEALVKKQAQ